MSVKKAQKIVNKFDEEFGISLVAYQLSDLERMKEMLEDFLDCEVETEDLADADDQRDQFGLDEVDEEEEDLE